jgi:regulator of protease activity HflC (stomatin/prohibitin superfamily)
MTNQAPDIMIEVTEPEEKRSYRQLAVLLILVVVLTFMGLLWKTEVGCFIFLSLTLLIARFWPPPKWRRLFTVIWIIIAIALVVGVFIYRRLDTPDMSTTIANNILLRFLIGATWSKVLWSATAGLLVGICLVWGPLLTVMYVSSEWLLAMRKTFGVTRGQALRLLVSIVLNVNYPYYLIEDGKMTLVKPKGVLDRLGGPGVAVIEPYNAVVFERAGKITRIEGPDMFMTKLFEFPKHIIDLRPQWESFPVEEVLTKDKVPLHIECGLGYRIESREQTAERGEDPREVVEGRRFPGIISGDYPVYKRTIFRAAYGPAGDWKITTKGATITKLREVVSEFGLRDIYRRDEQGKEFTPGEQGEELVPNEQVKEFVLAEIGRMTKERVAEIAHYWGVRVGTVNIDTIEVSEAVRDQVWKMWGAEYARRSALIEAEGKKGVVVTEAEAEREAASIKADAERIKAMGGAEALTIEARGEREAAVEKGRGAATAKAEEFAQIVEALRRTGLRDEQMLAKIIIAVFRAVGYMDYYPMDMLPTRRPRRGEPEAEEEGQAE